LSRKIFRKRRRTYSAAQGQPKKLNKGGNGVKIPQHEIESLARCLLPEMRRYFESEKGKRELKKWEEEQKEKKEKKK